MIKFSRLDTDKARAAVASLQKAKAAKESYNTPEVNAALADMFCGKCYICENKDGIDLICKSFDKSNFVKYLHLENAFFCI